MNQEVASAAEALVKDLTQRISNNASYIYIQEQEHGKGEDLSCLVIEITWADGLHNESDRGCHQPDRTMQGMILILIMIMILLFPLPLCPAASLPRCLPG